MIVIRCSNCNKTWEEKSFITSNTYICPFCGADLDGTELSGKELNIRMALKKILENDNVEITDVRRINALLMDYVPKLQRERKLIVSALREGIGVELSKTKKLTNSEQTQAAARCAKQLTSDIWITETAAFYAVTSIAFALGIDIESEVNSTVHNESSCNNRREIIFADNKEATKGLYDSKENINDFLSKYGIIGYKAFAANKNLQNVEIPDCITKIRGKAFMNCSNLRTIKISSNIESVAEGVFDGCYKLESIIIGQNKHYCVTNNILIDKSERKALRAANINTEKVVIPDGIVIICDRAFDRNLTEKIILSKSVTGFSQKSFFECYKLKSFYVDSKNPVFVSLNGVLHSKNKTKLIFYPIGKEDTNYFLEDDVIEIGNGAFSKAAHLISITFNSMIKNIGIRAFEYCRSLESIMLPSSIERIGERAFQYCSKLRSVMLSRNINEIGDFAFCECESLENISIPKNVDRIGNSAFLNCRKLEKVIIQDNVRYIGEAAFNGCKASLHISIKNNRYVENYCRSHKISYDAMMNDMKGNA